MGALPKFNGNDRGNRPKPQPLLLAVLTDRDSPFIRELFKQQQRSLWLICPVEMCNPALKFPWKSRNGDGQGEIAGANVTLLAEK